MNLTWCATFAIATGAAVHAAIHTAAAIADRIGRQ